MMFRPLLRVFLLLGLFGVVRIDGRSADNFEDILSELEEALEPRGTDSEQDTGNEKKSDQMQEVFSQRTSVWDQPRVSDLEGSVWQMVFRAQSGNGQSVYSAWKDGTGVSTVKPVHFGRSYAAHYRDPIVAQWSSLKVRQVKFALYYENSEVAYIVFNGFGSDHLNWFSKDNVIAASYSDLTASATYNYFSFVGHEVAGHHYRRFFVNKLYNGCGKDLGWIDVADIGTVDPCHMDRHAVLPQFLYSTINGADYWEKGMYGRADYIAIFVSTY